MSERPFTLDDEARFHAENRAGMIRANALQERINKLPIRTRLAIYKAAGEGGNLAKLVDEAEAAST